MVSTVQSEVDIIRKLFSELRQEWREKRWLLQSSCNQIMHSIYRMQNAELDAGRQHYLKMLARKLSGVMNVEVRIAVSAESDAQISKRYPGAMAEAVNQIEYAIMGILSGVYFSE